MENRACDHQAMQRFRRDAKAASALSFPTALLLLFVYLFRLHFFSVHLHFAVRCHSLSIR
jgi:hypothetical protein